MEGDLGNFVAVPVALFLLVYTTMGVWHPAIFARQLEKLHPGIDVNDKTFLRFIRFICAGGLGISLVVAMVIIRSFGI